MSSKRAVADAILAKSPMRVHLDPRRNGVVVPVHYHEHPSLILELGRNLRVPIPDLVVDDVGVSGTLTFGGEPFHCVVPWGAVFGLVDPDGRGQTWKEDIPTDLPSTPLPERHETECSFCGKNRKDVAYLVAAERASICNECILAARATRSIFETLRSWFFVEPDEPALPAKPASAYRDGSVTACSFCRLERHEVLGGPNARICRSCVKLAYDVLVDAGAVR